MVEVMFVLMVLWLVLIVVNSGFRHTCGGGYVRKKHNVEKYNLDGLDYGLQINKNWIWKKNDEVEEDADETILILIEHQGLKIRLKENKAF